MVDSFVVHWGGRGEHAAACVRPRGEHARRAWQTDWLSPDVAFVPAVDSIEMTLLFRPACRACVDGSWISRVGLATALSVEMSSVLLRRGLRETRVGAAARRKEKGGTVRRGESDLLHGAEA